MIEIIKMLAKERINTGNPNRDIRLSGMGMAILLKEFVSTINKHEIAFEVPLIVDGETFRVYDQSYRNDSYSEDLEGLILTLAVQGLKSLT